MNFSALARIPFQAVLAVCEAVCPYTSRYPLDDADALNEVEGAIEVHEPDAPYLRWASKDDFREPWGMEDEPRASCLGCGYPHSSETACLRNEAAERLARNPETKARVEASAANIDKAVELEIHARRGMGAEDYCTCDCPWPCPKASPAVPPAGDSPDEVEPGSPPIASAPSSGSDLGGYTAPEVFAPEYVPTSELLHSAAHMIGLFNQDDIACALMSQLRERADMFRAVEDVPK